MGFENLTVRDIISARGCGHEIGLQVLVDESTPPNYSVTSGVGNDHVALNSLDAVWEYLESERRAVLVYEDPFVVVYKQRVHGLKALNRSSREQSGVQDAAAWRIYAHDDGTLLDFGLDSTCWFLSGDVTGLLQAGVLDCRAQWAELHAKLNAALESPDNVIPYVATTDAYAISAGLRYFVSSKWPRIEWGSPWLRMPVIQASIPDYYYREDLGRTGSGLLAIATMGALITCFDPGATKEECLQLVAERVKAHEVRTIILHDLHNLEQYASIHCMLGDLVNQAKSLGCKIVLVGSPEFCWHLRTEVTQFSFDLILPRKPACLEPNLFESMRQFVRSAGYTVELDLSPEMGELIWSAAGQDRARAIALCRSMVFDCNAREVSEMDQLTLEKITLGTVV